MEAYLVFGNEIGRLCEEWWKANGDRHDSPAWQMYVDDLSRLFGEKMLELKKPHSNGEGEDKRFGMSKSSGCTRSAALKFLGEPEEPHEGSDLVTFHFGHLVELIGIATLRAVGYDVQGQQEPVRIDPFMHSFSDGIMSLAKWGPEWTHGPLDTILSVKSIGYKKSGKENGKWVRRGFPELPFEGIRKAQPSWWAQVQAEMWGSGLDRAVVLAVAKDTVKAMSADPYLGDGEGKGNGSLAFYSETIDFDPDWCTEHLLPVWEETWGNVSVGDPGKAFYLSADNPWYVELYKASYGYMPNASLTGTFNPCDYCGMRAACERIAKEGR